MTTTNNSGIIAAKSGATKITTQKKSIKEWIGVYQGQIAKALPAVMTPERFCRITMTAVTNTPKLAECTPESFIGSMMQAAQLGLEPNTVLGQAYLIPYGRQCQFQIGYKGLIDLAYRSGEVKTIIAQIVYENDEFEYEYGLEPKLSHKPAKTNRGNAEYVYAVFKLKNGGEGFEVMSIEDVKAYGKKFSKTYGNGPWQTNFDEMAKKTVIKRVLKYAPLKSDFVRAVAADEKTITFDANAENEEEMIKAEYTVSEEGEVIENEQTGK